MYLTMAGIDFHTASVELREHFTFTEEEISEFLQMLSKKKGVKGCAAIVTCNRTELYMSVSNESVMRSESVLMSLAKSGIDHSVIYSYENEDAAKHLMEVACGLHSQILHEEQIVKQVNQSISLARKLGTSDAVIDTLFRTAVSAGKYALTNVSQPGISLSLAYEAVRRLELKMGSLSGKKCVIIGNGKMGRLVSDILVKKDCCVYLTLRSYLHGQNIIPKGTIPVKYEDRIKYIDGADIVISATRSPHYTITFDMINSLNNRPEWLIDLAMPCDIDSKCSQFSDVNFRNLDSFNTGTQIDEYSIYELKKIAAKYAENFREWSNYREAVPYIEKLKRVMPEHIFKSTAMDGYRQSECSEEIVYITANKIIDMLMGSLKHEINPEMLESCFEKISSRVHIQEKEE